MRQLTVFAPRLIRLRGGGQTTINLGREHKDYMDIERKLEGRSQREYIQKLIAKDMGRHPNEAGFAEVIEAI